MGKLVYAGTPYQLDDRLLAHLKVVITVELSKGRGFLLNWSVPASEGSGRVSLWMSPGIPLLFEFHTSAGIPLSREWLDALEHSSHRLFGMDAMSEDEANRYL